MRSSKRSSKLKTTQDQWHEHDVSISQYVLSPTFNHLTAQAQAALDLPQQQLVMLPRYGRRQHSAPRCRLRRRHRTGGCCGRRAPRADAEGGTADEGRDAFEQQKWWKRTAVPWVNIWWFSLWYQCFTVRTLFLVGRSIKLFRGDFFVGNLHESTASMFEMSRHFDFRGIQGTNCCRRNWRRKWPSSQVVFTVWLGNVNGLV